MAEEKPVQDRLPPVRVPAGPAPDMPIVAGELRKVLNQLRLRGGPGIAEHRPRSGMGQQEMFRINVALQGRSPQPHLRELVAAQTHRDLGLIDTRDSFGVGNDSLPPALPLHAQCVAMLAHVAPSRGRGRSFSRKDRG